MNRDAFMHRIHELAELLGAGLYELVAAQSDALRAQALEHAKGKLRAALELEQPAPTPARKQRAAGKVRAQQRCSICKSTEHNARRCDAASDADEPDKPSVEASPAPPVASPPPLSSRPCRSVRRDRGSGGRAPCRRAGGRWRVIDVRNSPRCRN